LHWPKVGSRLCSTAYTLLYTLEEAASSTKRYQGGYNETIWRFDGSGEAAPLTADWAGTSRNPMFWNGAFISFDATAS